MRHYHQFSIDFRCVPGHFEKWRPVYETFMMTPSNGNIFRVTGPLCREFTGPGEFPTQRPATRSFDGFFFYLRLNKRLSKQLWGWWFETPPWSLWRQCNVLEFIGGQTRVAKLLHAVYSAFCLLTALCRQVLGHQQTQWWQNVVIWMYGVGAQWIKAQTLCAARNSHQTQVSRNPVRREHLF